MTNEVTAAQVARALDEISTALAQISQWVANVRLIVLELPQDTPIRAPELPAGIPTIDLTSCRPKAGILEPKT